ncbi:MAG TPA: LysM peptidoglycan-binding domain-containing protein [Chloroflexi bacterium]|nr:LysM peptidoglycan-binding domain-containing protein [Chloroflexota bacterium]
MATSIYGLTGERRWLPPLARVIAHLAVVLIAISVVGLRNLEWPVKATSSSLASALPASTDEDADEKNREETISTPKLLVNQIDYQNHTRPMAPNVRVISRQADPHTIIPDRPRLGVITYTVQAGDTVQSIANTFGLQPTTLMWADSAIEDAPDLLRIGQLVTILPIDGVYHTVAEDDTLASIAEKYDVEPEAIVNCSYNALNSPDAMIQVGTKLIVPGGEKPYVPKVVTTYAGSAPEGARGTGRFQWPVLGQITQGYWYGHRAIDIGAPTGSAVQAVDGGFVSFAGWTDVGYGYLLVIDHANGFATYYAHLSNMYVSTGQAVDRGQVIGAVGSTGWSTGPHLHFEVRYYGVQQNPRAYLP